MPKGWAFMTEDQFSQVLAEEGFTEARTVDFEPDMDGELHTHEFSAMSMVVKGELTLTYEVGSETFTAGQSCGLVAGTVHAERTGPSGATILVGTK